MALEIHRKEREGVTILDMKGRITVGPEATALRQAVAAAVADGVRQLVFDLAQVDFIDTTGLGAVVMCSTTLRKAGGAVKLLNLNRRNIELLVMTKLATVFETLQRRAGRREQLLPRPQAQSVRYSELCPDR